VKFCEVNERDRNGNGGKSKGKRPPRGAEPLVLIVCPTQGEWGREQTTRIFDEEGSLGHRSMVRTLPLPQSLGGEADCEYHLFLEVSGSSSSIAVLAKIR
jgi:hypothetical protein